MTDLPLASLFPAASQESWRAAVEKVLKGADFEKKLVSRTADAIAIQPLYAKAEVMGGRALRRKPGPWRIVQRVDHPDASEAAELAVADLEGGADGLCLSFTGSAAARGHGLKCDDVAALDRAIEGVRLDLIHLRLDPAPANRVRAAMVAALAERRGHKPADLDIDFGLDPIGNFARLGSFVASKQELGQRLAEAVSALSVKGFAGPFACADGRPYHEAGASEAQELAGVLATALAYLRALEAGGLSLDKAREAVSFLLVADTDAFLTIAKFRALRRLWARMEEACGLQSRPALVHAETAWRSATKHDPWVNMLRATVATFAAGTGAADTLTVLPFTAALGLPDAFARRIARNTQLILIEESNLAKVTDPAAGAGGFEALTEALCEKAWAAFQEIEREGGIVQALSSGALQKRIAAVRSARDKAVASRRDPITGTSEFPNLAEMPVLVLSPPQHHDASPGATGETTDFGQKLDFSGMIAAFAKGEARRSLSPEPRKNMLRCEPLPSIRLAEPFEALRDASDAILTRTGSRPKIFLANLGPIAAFTSRAMFARNFFEAGGIEAVTNDGFPSQAALVEAFRASGAKLACLCSSDEIYPEQAVPAAEALKAAGATHLYLAGRPGTLEAALKQAGVGTFIHVGTDVLSTLREAHAIFGS